MGNFPGTHPSFPHVRLSSVRVTGNNATYTMSCSGAQYCAYFTGPNVSQAIVARNWEMASRLQLRQIRELRTLSQLRLGKPASGNTASGNTGSGSTSAGTAGAASLTAFCSDLNGVVNTIANATGNIFRALELAPAVVPDQGEKPHQRVVKGQHFKSSDFSR